MRLFIVLAALASGTLTMAQTVMVTVPLGTPVILATEVDLSSTSNVKGDMVPLRVAEDVVLGGRVVIRRGAEATEADHQHRGVVPDAVNQRWASLPVV